jgi:N6-adenosine-specific RNA methylase IME4
MAQVPENKIPPHAGLLLPGKLTSTGWMLPAGMAFEQWQACGKELIKVGNALQWWLGDWWAYGEHGYGKRIEAMRDGLFGEYAFGTLMTYGWVASSVETSIRIEVLSFAHHRHVAHLAAAEQREWLARAVEKGWSSSELKAAIARQAAIDNNIEDGCTVADLNALIRAGKKFRTIYADPPWVFKVYSGLGKSRSAERHYQVDETTGESTLSLDDLKELPVEQLAADDCALFLWAVMPELPGAIEVLRAWGFNYKTVAFTWVKQTGNGNGLHWGMGYWTRANAELCLLGTRGAPQRIAKDVHQIIMSPVGEHSRKPEETNARIERLLSGPYLELFARRPMIGWTVWGNQITRNLFHQSIPEFSLTMEAEQ